LCWERGSSQIVFWSDIGAKDLLIFYRSRETLISCTLPFLRSKKYSLPSPFFESRRFSAFSPLRSDEIRRKGMRRSREQGLNIITNRWERVVVDKIGIPGSDENTIRNTGIPRTWVKLQGPISFYYALDPLYLILPTNSCETCLFKSLFRFSVLGFQFSFVYKNYVVNVITCAPSIPIFSLKSKVIR
jgi:hypothetical protein